MSELDSNKRPSRLRRWYPLLGLLLVGTTLSAVAGSHAAKPVGAKCANPFANDACRLSARELDAYRGGFESGDGFEFSIGLTNLHQINDGPLVAQNLLELKHVVAGFKGGVSAGFPRSATIQVGPDNRITPGILNSATGLPPTIIQNSLNGQFIKNARVFDIQLDNVRALTNALTVRQRSAMLKQQLVDTIR